MSPYPKSPPLRELTPRQLQWIAGGYVLTLSTMPGQTIFIAQFNTSLRDAFGLSHGAFGGLYTAGTLASAFCLVFAGVLADRMGARRLAIATLVCLAATALFMASLTHVATLVAAIAMLRFFGQGMLTHVAMTTISRWFNRFRGRALSFVGLGFTTGEAILPFTITLAIATFGWREVWMGTALVLLAVSAPLAWLLFRDPPDGKRALARGAVNPDAPPAGGPTGAQWTRGRVLRDPLFFLILAGTMAPPAIGTLFIFHQAHLAAIKGWDIIILTASFPVMSVSVVAASIVAGFFVDRFGAWQLVPALLLPLGAGCLVLATLTPVWVIPVFLLLFGMTIGLMAPVLGALWAEVYGTAHLGAVRSLATAALVSASAVGPGIAGLLIDLGIELDVQGFGYALYCFAGAALFVAIRPRFRTRVIETTQQPVRDEVPIAG
jgi:MFS family permease